MYRLIITFCCFCYLLIPSTSCTPPPSGPGATTYDFPSPVDTETKPIVAQIKKDFLLDGEVSASNKFNGARLNDFQRINHNTYRATILPENEPINDSPWYAFKIWGTGEQQIDLQLDYQSFGHRYQPKTSRDGVRWEILDSLKIKLNNDSTVATLNMTVSTDTLWVSAQELINSQHVDQWCQKFSESPWVRSGTIGSSTQGRPMLLLDIYRGKAKSKPIIVILSRQHPPEVTGFMALQAFLERITDGSQLSQEFLGRYRLLVYPLMNPDGVDNGHWRHNAGGIDLNRDWAYYHQQETRTVANHVVNTVQQHKSKVILGLDFHSTWYDVYYTNENDSSTSLPNFTSEWLTNIEKSIPGYHVNEQPSGLRAPVSKGWFSTQFNAVGITYEIGDNTPREFIRQKGEVSAEQMMKILVEE